MTDKSPDLAKHDGVAPTGQTSAKTDSLEVLEVIERLEVGPVKLEKNRLVAPYTIIQNGRQDSIELIYGFEESVFDPTGDESHNLASMIAAQIAINYGLFCKTLFFHGLYDNLDRRFIRDMAENTAREIYVKKFLQSNPFILGEAAYLPAIKKERYLRATIEFSEVSQRKSEPNWRHWQSDRLRHTVLSSGGKDSLLTFGLLKEIGYEVHPIFVNESGRHWFTALNSYRYFRKNVPRTARVWTNADRVFAWMLRHLSFVRQDFAKVRSDEYPIRLWTVAVFIFGVLPLVRKRGIGRLLIGDEFDTTRRISFRGIPHYDGLYDQSRHFDNALTRYYMRKGWVVSQFSVLRPLSDLLVEKVLAERYPELQSQQVSCHATHKEGSRIHPCGKCEKCRRTVVMVMALGMDPSNWGYKQSQVDDCMKAMSEKRLNQETEAVQHMAFLLKERGLIARPSLGSVRARQRPEIMKLRFDPERSPLEGIPADLREPLYRIYLKYADGAVKRSGRVWIDFDPVADSAMTPPYPFESPTAPSGAKISVQKEPTKATVSYLLGELTWSEAEDRFRVVDVALLPVGSTEQHGPHLPLDTDSFDAEYLARQVAAACTDPKPLVLPLIPYGVSYHHEDFSGTISIGPDTLSRLVYEVGMSVARHGITKLVIINGHGGNTPALEFASQMINRDAHIFTCVDTGETSETDIYAMAETPNDVHAGEIETSTALAVRPELVRLSAARRFVPRFSSRYLNFTSKRSVAWSAHVAKISRTGVLGDPTKASREKGQRMWQVMIERLVEFVESLKSMSLDEIYQKRY